MFLRTYMSGTKFSKVFLRAYISLTKSHMYSGCNVLCIDDNMYSYVVRLFMHKLVADNLDINKLVMNGPGISNIPLHK